MRVAVVGHGPSLAGRGLGPEIDACDLVVRLHDCEWQTPRDYGHRYSYGVLPGPWLSLAVSQVQRVPFYGWLIYHFGKLTAVHPKAHIFDLCEPNKSVREGGPAPCGKSHPNLSRGAAALLMAARLEGVTSVVAFGFDAVLCGCAWDYAHMERTDLSRHNAAAENTVLRGFIENLEVHS